MSGFRKPLILFYNSFFGADPDIDRLNCPNSEFSTDRRRIEEADAVVFHLPDAREIGDARKYPGQRWVGWSMESKANTPIRSDTAAMRHFDLMMTFERSADVWCPYMPPLEHWQAALAAAPRRKTEASPLVMFQSASNDRSQRNAAAADLMRHIPVDSYGRFLNNRSIDGPDRGSATKLEVIGRYRFCLGLENTIEDDYVTEKFFQPLLAGTVPVYRGAANVDDFAPGDHCYIDANRFGSTRELADYLQQLVHDPAAYEAYFEWRSRPLRPGFLKLLKQCETEAFCRLGAMLQSLGTATTPGAALPFGWQRNIGTRLRRLRARVRSIRGRG